MIENRKSRLSITLAAAVLLTAGALWAQPRSGAGRFGPPGAGAGPDPAAALLHGPLGERLELTDEQRDQIRAIFEAQRETTRPWHEDVRGLGAELEQAIEAEPFDEEAVRALARQMADLRVELAVSRARTGQQVREVLTPDQRETLGELRAQRRQHREGFGGPGGRGFHRRGPG